MTSNHYASQLQNQIYRLQSAYQEQEITSVLEDTRGRFPVQQIIMARIYCAGLQNISAPSHISYNDLLTVRNLYIETLQDELIFVLNSASYAMWTEYALNTLYYNPPYFTSDYILYESNGRRLTVSDLLKVIGYAKKSIETVGMEVDPRFSYALTALNSLDLVLNNKKEDKPFNKALHIANDVLSDIAKSLEIKSVSDSQISGISLLFDLAIDFLVKR